MKNKTNATIKAILKEFEEKMHLAVESGGFLRFPFDKEKKTFLDERLMSLFISQSLSRVVQEAGEELFNKLNKLKLYKKDYKFYYDAEDINRIVLDIKLATPQAQAEGNAYDDYGNPIKLGISNTACQTEDIVNKPVHIAPYTEKVKKNQHTDPVKGVSEEIPSTGKYKDKIINLGQPMLSKCCKAPLKVVSGGEGTSHYECTKCGKSADIFVEEEKHEN